MDLGLLSSLKGISLLDGLMGDLCRAWGCRSIQMAIDMKACFTIINQMVR